MLLYSAKNVRFAKISYCIILSLLLISDGSTWLHNNEEPAPICYNAKNHLGLCVPLKECTALSYVSLNNLLANLKPIMGSICERSTGVPPFICCTNGMKLRAKQEKSLRNERIIFPNELELPVATSGSETDIPRSQQIQALPSISTEYIVLEEIKSVASTPPTLNLSSNETGRVDYFPKPPGCGSIVVGNRIYGGQNADLSEFSWMTILEYRNQTTGLLLMDCAGSLISNRYVLTAAHCAKGDILRSKGRLESVRVGEHNTESETDCNENRCLQRFQRISIEVVLPHPDYRSISYEGMRNQHDIALLRLKRAVKFNEFLQPICLPDVAPSEDLEESTKFVVAGWGHNGTMVRTAIKQKLELPLVKHETCRQIYKKKFYLADQQICAGGHFREDSCNGDSGGPLMRIEGSYWILEGIVSFGLKCGLEMPGIYTNVRSYIDWIKDNVKAD